jgi:hypothetical protein
MERVDSLSPSWRKLVREYGLLIVEQYMAHGYSLRAAAGSLGVRRGNMQKQYETPFPERGRIETVGRRGLNVEPGDAWSLLVTNL